MLVCHDQRTGTGCGAVNQDNAQFCKQCGRALRFAVQLHNPGEVIGAYRIVRVIGHGGFGAVYEAQETAASARTVALKETFDPDQIQSYQAEFAVLARLQHPHLPRYDNVFTAGGNGYLVMELVPGQSLEEVLKKQGGPLLEAQVLGYALQLCDALAYLHRQTPTILHRDIKPANVRLTPEGLIKLVDFGLVKEGGGTTRHSRRAVTPPYAPPEQWGIGGQHTDPRSDLYALGATLYHLLTGLEPPPATDRISVTPDPLLAPQYVNPSLSATVSDAIVQSMALAVNQRPADAAAFRRSLWGGGTPAPGNAGPRVSSSPPPPPSAPSAPTPTAAKISPAPFPIVQLPPPKQPSRSTGWLWWLLVPGAIAAVIGYIFLSQNATPGPTTGMSYPDTCGGEIVYGQALYGEIPTRGNCSYTFAGQAGDTVDIHMTRQGDGFDPFLQLLDENGDVLVADDDSAGDLNSWIAAYVLPANGVYMISVQDLNFAAGGPFELSLARADVVVTDSAGVPYVYVPAGEFLMGSPDGVGDDDEHPQHTVYLDAFWIMQTEVTNAQYTKCVTAGACSAPNNSRWQDAAYADHPVTDVNWNQATEYAQWVGGRLPTEAEWEKAARGTDGRTYPWGEEQPDQSLANCCDFVNDITPVGSYPAGVGPYGALDMAGNVWEWTADWYASNYYSWSSVQNPTGPDSGVLRVLRGGAFWVDASPVRVAYRLRYSPYVRYRDLGFRVASSSPGS